MAATAQNAPKTAESGVEDAEVGTPSGLPVRIVESERQAAERQAADTLSQRQQAADLIAQERMADATEAMNNATQSMKAAAWWSLLAVAVSNILLVWTLVLMSRANKAAIKAVEVTEVVSQNQARPWLMAQEYGHAMASNANIDDVQYDQAFVFWLVWKNMGLSPAIHAQLWSEFKFIDKEAELPEFEMTNDLGDAVLGQDATGIGKNFALGGHDLQRFLDREVDIVLFGYVNYCDAGNPGNQRRSVATYRLSYAGEQIDHLGNRSPRIEGRIVGPQNSAD